MEDMDCICMVATSNQICSTCPNGTEIDINGTGSLPLPRRQNALLFYFFSFHFAFPDDGYRMCTWASLILVIITSARMESPPRSSYNPTIMKFHHHGVQILKHVSISWNKILGDPWWVLFVMLFNQTRSWQIKNFFFKKKDVNYRWNYYRNWW